MSARLVCPMQWSWRAALLFVAGLGLLAATLCGLELAGIVARGALVGQAGDGERIAGVVVGLGLQPFAWTVLRNARLTLGPEALSHLRFGLLGRTDTIPLREVRRWGVGRETNRGYRHRVLLLELQDHSRRGIKLQMYRRQDELERALAERLGPPAATVSRITGLTFAED